MTCVACIGDVSIDMYVTHARRYVGGISFNIAWNLRECGAEAKVFSAIGNDDDGAAVMRTFASRDISALGVLVREGLTAQQRIIVTPSGERIFDGYRIGVLQSLCLGDFSTIRLNKFDALHIPLSDGLEALFDACAREVHGVLKIADLSVDGPNVGGLRGSVERYAEYFDLLFVGGGIHDASYIQELARSRPQHAFVLTLGREGAICFQGHSAYRQEALAVNSVVDTTGCGDGFQAAFIARWLADRDDIPSALHAGAAQGARVASYLGATPCVIAEP